MPDCAGGGPIRFAKKKRHSFGKDGIRLFSFSFFEYAVAESTATSSHGRSAAAAAGRWATRGVRPRMAAARGSVAVTSDFSTKNITLCSIVHGRPLEISCFQREPVRGFKNEQEKALTYSYGRLKILEDLAQHIEMNTTAGHAFRPYGHAFTLSPLAWERKNRSLSTPRARFLRARLGHFTKKSQKINFIKK